MVDLRVHPGRFGFARSYETAQIAVPIRVAEVELRQGFEGGGRGRNRCDQNRLVRLGEVSPARTVFEEEALCLRDSVDGSCHGRVVRVPRLDDRGNGRPNGLGKRRQRQAIEYHREGVTLGDSLSREDDLTVVPAPTQEELGGMPVAVEAEPGTVGPAMPHGPEHGLAAELVEAVGRVDQEDGGGGIRGEA